MSEDLNEFARREPGGGKDGVDDYGRCDMAETMTAWRGNLGPCELSPMVARDSRYEKPASARPNGRVV